MSESINPTDQGLGGWNDSPWDSMSTGQGDQPDQPVQPPPGPTPTQAPTWRDFALLLEGFNAMGERLLNTQNATAQTSRALDAITDRLAQLSTGPVTGFQPAPFVQPTSSAIDPRSTPRFREPSVFKGKPEDVKTFLQDVRDAVRLSRASLPTPEDQCIYMATFLDTGAPKQWYTSCRAVLRGLTRTYLSSIVCFLPIHFTTV